MTVPSSKTVPSRSYPPSLAPTARCSAPRNAPESAGLYHRFLPPHRVDHPILLVADAHHLDAGMGLPLRLHCLDAVPALGELHAVTVAVDQVLVAALIDANDRYGRA